MHFSYKILIVCCLVVIQCTAQSASASPWQQVDNVQALSPSILNVASQGSYWQLDESQLRQQLNLQQPFYHLLIPLPDGTQTQFTLTPSRVMAPALAAKYPQLRSFNGQQNNAPTNKGRFDLSPSGFSGMFKWQGEWVILSNQSNDSTTVYVSYKAKDEINQALTDRPKQDFLSLPANIKDRQLAKSANTELAISSGEQIRTFRLAVSASGEYTRANGGEAGAMAEIVRLVNRVNQVLLTDLSMQFELVANNDRLIFTDAATDPFTNTDSAADIEANQQTIDDLIGSENYDMGHVLNTKGGGLATVRSLCLNGFKARGQTGRNTPSGEAFYIDLVIHEFGHQLGAAHTFNASEQGSCSSEQRSRNAAVEPGSGSTIMAYAGLCGGQNIVQDTDAYYHAFSIEEIREHIDRISCGINAPSGNTIPVILTAPQSYIIPALTPFMLSAQASDADNDTLSYAWDQINPGGLEGATTSTKELGEDNGFNPLFRSRVPSTNATRYFPQLSNVLSGFLSIGEVYPSTDRTLNFQMVVRDGKGGVNTLTHEVQVITTERPFSVTSPTSDDTWFGGTSQNVAWDVATTDLPPFSCDSVDISLDADGNGVFETVLLQGAPNTGSASVVSPSTTTANARLMVRCASNIFYAVNPARFSISAGAQPVAPVITGQQVKISAEDTPFTVNFSDLNVDDPDTTYPDNFTLTVNSGQNYTVTNALVTPVNNFNGELNIPVSVNDGVNDSNIFNFVATISAVNDNPQAIDDSASTSQDSDAIIIEVLANDIDNDGDSLRLIDVTYTGTGQVMINGSSISYTPATGFSGTDSFSYQIEDTALAVSSATVTISVEATLPEPPPTPTPTPTQPTDSNGGGGGSLGISLLVLGMVRIMICATHRRSTCLK